MNSRFSPRSLSTLAGHALLVFSAVLGLLLGMLVVADVIGRVVFNSPVQGTAEIVSTSIVLICFMQAPHAIRSGGMIHVDFLLHYFSPRLQSALACLGGLLGVALFAFICWGSFEPAAHAWSSGEFEGEGALRVPSWPARFSVLVGTALCALNYVFIAIDNLRAALAGQGPVTGEAAHV